MADDRLRVRIDASEKARAMERAAAQGVTLSGAIRDLLALWCEGHIDLQALGALVELPSEGELAKLGETLGTLTANIESAREELHKFSRWHGHALGIGETLRARRWFGL